MQGGGGGQYAIITQFKMKVYQQPTGSTATSVSYTWDLNKATAVKGLAWYNVLTHEHLARPQAQTDRTIMQIRVRCLPSSG